MTRPAEALIDVGALHHNLSRVRALAPRSRILAIVKANGYGHGLARVGRALQGADGFGVACLEEALALRTAGIRKRILLLGGVFEASELSLVNQQSLDVVVHDETQVEMLERTRLSRPVSVWLKVDTGMHRLGVPPASVPRLWQRLGECVNVSRPIRLLSHLASADERREKQTSRQLSCLLACAEGTAPELSIANSAAVLARPESHHDWVRPGIMLYGISPFADSQGKDYDLRPAMTLSTQLIAVKRVEEGETIGYGGTWRCPRAMPVGVAAIGYGDGYPRHAPSGTAVLVNGEPVPLIGRVSMDLITLDLRSQPRARSGDRVVLWGRGLPIEGLARRTGTIAYELVCRVASRVRFIEEA
jgi:alanine racemase